MVKAPILPPRVVIFYRASLMEPEELAAAQDYFVCTPTRMAIQAGDTVVGRYSMIPYDEIAADLRHVHATPINSERAHGWIADVGDYSMTLGALTPRTWGELSEAPKNGGPFVLKGATNSKKFQWKTHMYAKDWNAARDVVLRLMDDSLIGAQRIYVRQYVPLETLWTNISGTPITREFRFFVYKGQILSSGFYWDAYSEDLREEGISIPDPAEVPEGFLTRVLFRVSEHATFMAVDVAKATDGQWWVIDINDGQQAGLCGNDPHVLYSKLRAAIDATP